MPRRSPVDAARPAREPGPVAQRGPAAAAHRAQHGARRAGQRPAAVAGLAARRRGRERRSRPAAGQPRAGRRAGRAGRAGQRRRRGRGAGGGAARRADRLPARRGRGGRRVVVAGRPGARPAARGHGDGAAAVGRVARHPPGAAATPAARSPSWRPGFDAMLDRLQAAFDAQRRFVANASHELRTPLAVLRTEVDVTLADPDADVAELRRMGEVVREATRRADELIAGLLLLARSEAPSAVDPAAVRRSTSPRSSCPPWPRRAPRRRARGLRVREHRAPAPTVGDPVLLERVAGNLVENAVRHNVAGGLGGDPHRGCAGRVGRAVRQLRGPGDRPGAGGGAVRAVPARAGGPHGRHAGLGAGALDRPGGGARARRDGGGRTGAGRRPAVTVHAAGCARARRRARLRRLAARRCPQLAPRRRARERRAAREAGSVRRRGGRGPRRAPGRSARPATRGRRPARSAAAIVAVRGRGPADAAQEVGLQQVLRRDRPLRRERRDARAGGREPRGGGRVAVRPARDGRGPVARGRRLRQLVGSRRAACASAAYQ